MPRLHKKDGVVQAAKVKASSTKEGKKQSVADRLGAKTSGLEGPAADETDGMLPGVTKGLKAPQPVSTGTPAKGSAGGAPVRTSIKDKDTSQTTGKDSGAKALKPKAKLFQL